MFFGGSILLWTLGVFACFYCSHIVVGPCHDSHFLLQGPVMMDLGFLVVGQPVASKMGTKRDVFSQKNDDSQQFQYMELSIFL